MNARDEILARVRAGLADRGTGAGHPVDWVYGRATPLPDVLGRFVERCEDYQARVIRVAAPDVGPTLVRVLRESGITSAVWPAGLDAGWRAAVLAAGVTVIADDPPLTRRQLDETGGVVTAARVAVAETGTIVLDHAADQGRRALSLVPDFHLAIVRGDQVVSDVPEAVAVLRASIDAGRPLTWISGGSATSDIELERVEGVHGPRTLVIVLAE
ncbi:MAG: LUD domain-containing protein [Propionibacteriaceae bacterium]|jgi:L-lactate dehydrogenase complex protein LldG|nr:LUD domain-containing protein [Propionibacteriaceae bacterium]